MMSYDKPLITINEMWDDEGNRLSKITLGNSTFQSGRIQNMDLPTYLAQQKVNKNVRLLPTKM